MGITYSTVDSQSDLAAVIELTGMSQSQGLYVRHQLAMSCFDPLNDA